MQTVIILKDNGQRERYYCADALQFIYDYYGQSRPHGLRIFHNQVSEATEVTPQSKRDIERLQSLHGLFFVLIDPQASFIIPIVSTIALNLVSAILTPDQKQPQNQQQPSQSPNNTLSDRQNQERPMKRIPDIWGEVRSTPDLIAVPYKVYEDDREVEIAYMCIGRGEYDIPIDEIRDDKTRVQLIPGESVEVYGPGTSPNSGDEPQVSIGSSIGEKVHSAEEVSSINGQTLRNRGGGIFKGSAKLKYPDIIDWRGNGDIWDHLGSGDRVRVRQASEIELGDGTVNLNGEYTVDSIEDDNIILRDPSEVSSDWDKLSSDDNDATEKDDVEIEVDEIHDVGPFFIDEPDTSRIILNFYAPNGMYHRDESTTEPNGVDVRALVYDIDEKGNIDEDSEKEYSTTIKGKSKPDPVGQTLVIDLEDTGRKAFILQRMEGKKAQNWINDGGVSEDEVTIRSAYALSSVDDEHFGDVTTVMARTLATKQASSIKERKLNMLVTRKIDGEPTKNVADILRAVCLDDKIGRRKEEEIDEDNFYDVIKEVEEHFGTHKAVEFGHTFDDDDTSFEDIVQTICESAFCTAYRQGSQIKIKTDLPGDREVLMFNHRNKYPGSEKRTLQFGYKDNHDGVALEWTNPDKNDTTDTVYLPADQSFVNPKKIDKDGIRNKLQAYFHAWREFNKIRYQNEVTEFDALEEANILLPNDQVFVADDTRPDVQAGEIEDQDGKDLYLSIDVDIGDDAEIHIQHTDGTVEHMGVAQGDEPDHVIIDKIPKRPLSLDYANAMRALFHITHGDDPNPQKFIVQELSPESTNETTVLAVNYDERYYEHDYDYRDDKVTESGEVING